ncbi:uncharacterized protein [Apostichopus japonicus]|uniref:uncharacterized protein n=1 Tax=Stichopus japonicus TaxID=307972 RepID=UPI003AB383D3
MKLYIIAALSLVFIVSCEAKIRSLWCYKCMGEQCNSPVDSTKNDVFITECDKGICYTQETINEGILVTTRGCYMRRSECVPGCRGIETHQNCEKCCEQNLCNSARSMTFNLFALITSLVIGAMLMRR